MNAPQARLEQLPETKLLGQKVSTSFSADKTAELWRSFSPRRKEISQAVHADLFSVEIYPDTRFFEAFDPTREYEKWAAVEVSSFDNIPHDMHRLLIPAGSYAVFSYRGKPSEAQATFQYIYGSWLPNSPYELDDRPHFARMGTGYKGEDPDSEEEFWIPIRDIS